jgi:hypothetical protein
MTSTRRHIDRASAEYARAAEKVFSLQPRVAYTDTRDHFEVAGSAGNTYDVFLSDEGAYGCACRYGRREALCYHVVAVDVHKRETLARFEAEVAGKPFLPASRTLAICWQRELEAHRAACATCSAGEECMRAGKLMEKMGGLARAIAQAV